MKGRVLYVKLELRYISVSKTASTNSQTRNILQHFAQVTHAKRPNQVENSETKRNSDQRPEHIQRRLCYVVSAPMTLVIQDC
jgi:hypothetical protein